MKRGSMRLGKRIWFAVLMVSALVTGMGSGASAQCLAVAGDVDQSGVADVVDVQCEIVVVLGKLVGLETYPECLVVDPIYADFNCDGEINVTDIQLSLHLALFGLFPTIDVNGNNCADSCEDASCICDGACVEFCSGKDDDCDGFIDEGNVCSDDWTFPIAIDGLTGDLYAPGTIGEDWDLWGFVDFPSPALVDVDRLASGELMLLASKEVHLFDPLAGTWEYLGETENYITGICSDPNDSSIVYGTNSSGALYVLSDNFTNPIGYWTPNGASVDCVVLPSGRIVVFDSSYIGDTYYSDDGGSTFVPGGKYGAPGTGNLASVITSSSGTIFVNTGSNLVLSSTDGGESYTVQGEIPADPQTIQNLAISPTGPVYAVTPNAGYLGGKSFVSYDAGHTWTFYGDWKGTDTSSGWAEVIVP